MVVTQKPSPKTSKIWRKWERGCFMEEGSTQHRGCEGARAGTGGGVNTYYYYTEWRRITGTNKGSRRGELE